MEYVTPGGGGGAGGGTPRSVGNEKFPPTLGGGLECMNGESIKKLVSEDERGSTCV